MIELREQYKVPDVSDICPACAKWTNKVKNDLIDKVAGDLRTAIQARRTSTWLGRVLRCCK